MIFGDGVDQVFIFKDVLLDKTCLSSLIIIEDILSTVDGISYGHCMVVGRGAYYHLY